MEALIFSAKAFLLDEQLERDMISAVTVMQPGVPEPWVKEVGENEVYTDVGIGCPVNNIVLQEENWVAVTGKHGVVLGGVPRTAFKNPDSIRTSTVSLVASDVELVDPVVQNLAVKYGHKKSQWPPNTPILDSIWLTYLDPFRRGGVAPRYLYTLLEACEEAGYSTLSSPRSDSEESSVTLPTAPSSDSADLMQNDLTTTPSPKPDR
eukprot:TRINITY_DN30625_c0_g1_i1.p1 TRINITY_DN30625_c0_g1~~TRINITY_DN30625_c0_g1_i1.p1  ORF type:complete len:219 (+),score=32.14 TRINITY_DN30625_c0_g1_i1:39-659(+)